MTTHPFQPTFDDLPVALPLFPLSGVIMLPGGQLPLNIFEPRYLKMTTDCFQNGRMIGIIQPRADQPDPVPVDQVLYDVGCAGRLTSFSETDDGRYLITLTGVVRFHLTKELSTVNPYRMGSVDYAAFKADLHEPSEDGGTLDRGTLVAVCKDYFNAQGIEADLSGLDQVADQALVNSIAMACPLPGPEKQAILESTSLTQRFDLLVNLLRIASLPATGDGSPSIN